MNDLAHEIEAQPGAAIERLHPVEGLEDARTLLLRNACSLIHDIDGGGQGDANADRAPSASMFDRVLDQIGERALERRLVTHRLDAACRGLKRYVVSCSDCERREIGDNPLADRDEIHPGKGRPILVKALNVEQLLGQCCETGCILGQANFVGSLWQRFESRAQNGNRRAKFMRRIGGKDRKSVV